MKNCPLQDDQSVGPRTVAGREPERQGTDGRNGSTGRPDRCLRQFVQDRTAAVAVLAAFMFPVMLGGMGLGVEASYWYMTQRKLQHAADVAAHAAGVRHRAGDSLAEMDTAATLVATNSGYLPERGTDGDGVIVLVPPTSGAFADDPNAVEVIVSESWPRWFTAVFAEGLVPLRGRAVAQIQAGTGAACVLALSGTASPAVNVTGSTSVTLNGCEVASNSVSSSSVSVGGSGSLSTDCVTAVGGVTATDGLTVSNPDCPIPSHHAVMDPYADVPEPDLTTPCQSGNGRVGQPNNTTTVSPPAAGEPYAGVMHFCSGLAIQGDVTFEPGLYIISGGDFTTAGGGSTTPLIQGEGVTFFIADTAEVFINGTAQLQLSAPTTGTYAGILFFGARDGWDGDHLINGTAGSTLQGAMYFPAGDLSISGNSTGTNGCTQIIAQTVTFIGNSTLSSSCAASGTTTIVTNQPVAIVE